MSIHTTHFRLRDGWTPNIYVAFSQSYESNITHSSLNEIEKILKSFNGTIIFDLALSNGLDASNRFISAEINEGDAEGYFDRSSIKVIKPWAGLLTYSYLYYSAHPELVANSNILSDQHKEALLLR